MKDAGARQTWGLILATCFALGLLMLHGIYHLAEIEVVPRTIYSLLVPVFGPTMFGWTFHVFVELCAIAALFVAILEYRRALPRKSKVDVSDWGGEWDL